MWRDSTVTSCLHPTLVPSCLCVGAIKPGSPRGTKAVLRAQSKPEEPQALLSCSGLQMVDPSTRIQQLPPHCPTKKGAKQIPLLHALHAARPCKTPVLAAVMVQQALWGASAPPRAEPPAAAPSLAPGL